MDMIVLAYFDCLKINLKKMFLIKVFLWIRHLISFFLSLTFIKLLEEHPKKCTDPKTKSEKNQLFKMDDVYVFISHVAYLFQNKRYTI